MKRAAALAAGFALGLAAAGAGATPKQDSRTVTYPVSGATEAEVRESLDRSPLSPDGRRRVGYTQADISWEFRYRESGGRCRVVSATVTLNVTITLPEWTPPSGATRALRDRWDRFLGALTAHEQGHVDIALATAQRIEDALWRAPTQRSCKGYDDVLGRIANDLFDAAEVEQKKFDEDTDHGRTQGVSFP